MSFLHISGSQATEGMKPGGLPREVFTRQGYELL